MANNELTHHGIMGMKWGVRRYQNKDGTYTKAGKNRRAAERASDLSDEEIASRLKRHNLEKQYNKMVGENSKTSKMEKTKRVVDASSNAVNQIRSATRPSTKKERMDLSKMTDQQLRERINRENLERQYSDMFGKPATVSKGKQFLDKTLEVAGETLVLTGSALTVALAIKELKK